MTENKVRCVYPRLQLAYLLQFAIWGSWSVALGGYLTLANELAIEHGYTLGDFLNKLEKAGS